MSFLDMFDKLDDILYAPINVLCEWAGEPLKRSNHRREEESRDNELRREKEAKEHDMQMQVKMQTEAHKVLSEIDQANKDRDSDRRMKEFEHETEMAVKKETEVVRILEEIEQLKKDKELERMMAVTEAIMRFQERLTQINLEANASIGEMQIDLRDKAYNLIHEKSLKFKELQDGAWNDAHRDLKRIEEDFSGNEMAKRILTNAVESRLVNMITASDNFLGELNNDIMSINQNINVLTENGQKFIERHLEQFKNISYNERGVTNNIYGVEGN